MTTVRQPECDLCGERHAARDDYHGEPLTVLQPSLHNLSEFADMLIGEAETLCPDDPAVAELRREYDKDPDSELLGEWGGEALDAIRDAGYLVYDGDDTVLIYPRQEGQGGDAMSHTPGPKVSLEGTGRFIVEYEPPGGWRDDDDLRRFVRLIAQAPAMLAHLRRTVDALDMALEMYAHGPGCSDGRAGAECGYLRAVMRQTADEARAVLL